MRDFYQEYILTAIDDIKKVASSVLDGVRTHFALSEQRRYEVVLVLNELLVNCFDHAKPSKEAPVVVNVALEDRRLTVRVTDNGKGFEYEKNKSNFEQLVNEDTLYAEHGRGLMLVRAFCQEIDYYGKGNSVEVKMVL